MVVWRSGSAFVSINEVNLRRARLVLGWVTVSAFNSRCRTLFRYVTSHPGQLNLAIPSCVGAISTSQRAVSDALLLVSKDKKWFMCGWHVKLCDPIVTHGPYLSALETGYIIKRYINSSHLLVYFASD